MPNPFDFNSDGDLDFGECAFRDEFISGGFDVDDDDDEDFDSDDYDEYDTDSDWD